MGSALVGISNKDKIEYVYIHHGEPTVLGKVLKKYKTKTQVEEIINNGDTISVEYPFVVSRPTDDEEFKELKSRIIKNKIVVFLKRAKRENTDFAFMFLPSVKSWMGFNVNKNSKLKDISKNDIEFKIVYSFVKKIITKLKKENEFSLANKLLKLIRKNNHGN